jgi:hypothetical protein
MAEYLCGQYALSLVVLADGPIAPDRIAAVEGVVDRVESVTNPATRRGIGAGARRIFRTIRRRVQRPRPFWGAYCPPVLARAVRRVAAETGACGVIVNTPVLARSASRLPAAVFRVMDTHDVWHERYQNFAALGHGGVLEHFRDPRDEARLLEPFDLIVAITGRDAAALRRLVPGKPVVTAGVSYRVAGNRRAAPDEPPVVLFVGGRGAFNEDAVSYFVERIWPQVRERAPGARFTVLNASDHVRRRHAHAPGVVTREAVEEVASWYGRAHVVVVPLRYGTGFKIKVGEALAHGAATVLTPAAAQGLPVEGDRHFLLRETPEAFAEAVILLLTDAGAREALEEGARALVRDHLSPDRVYGEFREALARGLAERA